MGKNVPLACETKLPGHWAKFCGGFQIGEGTPTMETMVTSTDLMESAAISTCGAPKLGLPYACGDGRSPSFSGHKGSLLQEGPLDSLELYSRGIYPCSLETT